jgi:CBS domain containing-hemolysin-like protein
VRAIVEQSATLSDALNEMLGAPYRVAVVVDEGGGFRGVVDFETVNQAIVSIQADEAGKQSTMEARA